MALNPAHVAFFIPPGLTKFKRPLFARIGEHIRAQGGRVLVHDYDLLGSLPPDVIPIVGASVETKPHIDRWRAEGRRWVYWDRGYLRRIFATWLPRGAGGGYYRWHVGTFQMTRVRDVPPDRLTSLLPGNSQDDRPLTISPWREPPGPQGHIVVAAPSMTYQAAHGIVGWTDLIVRKLGKHTRRPIVVRDKESRNDLRHDLMGAHCLVTHGSIAAVEAVVMGCPVIVTRGYSAAEPVGRTDVSQVEDLVTPDRTAWLQSLAYSQFNERELVDGTLWTLIT